MNKREVLFEAELHRIRGELLLESGTRMSLRQALAVARQQQALFWELRAAACHSQTEGRCAEAAYNLLKHCRPEGCKGPSATAERSNSSWSSKEHDKFNPVVVMAH